MREVSKIFKTSEMSALDSRSKQFKILRTRNFSRAHKTQHPMSTLTRRSRNPCVPPINQQFVTESTLNPPVNLPANRNRFSDYENNEPVVFRRGLIRERYSRRFSGSAAGAQSARSAQCAAGTHASNACRRSHVRPSRSVTGPTSMMSRFRQARATCVPTQDQWNEPAHCTQAAATMPRDGLLHVLPSRTVAGPRVRSNY